MISNPLSPLQSQVSASLDISVDELDQTIAIVGGCQASANMAVSFGYTFNIVSVEDPVDLFKASQEQDIDLIILSTAQDRAKWIEQLKQIRSDDMLNLVPVIVLTEGQSVNQQLIAFELGALDCMAIPPNPFLLHAKVKNYMKLMKNVKQLELVSSTDGLTGLANRTQLDTTLTKEWYRMKRSKSCISALMIDVDYFKDFNDEFGHLAGDNALKSVAQTIQKIAGRESDFAARFGGEEFAILLPCTDQAGAEKIAASVIKEIQNLCIPSASKKYQHLTVSIGIHCCQPHLTDNQDKAPTSLLAQADQKLYKAKEQGRNRYCS